MVGIGVIAGGHVGGAGRDERMQDELHDMVWSFARRILVVL